MAFYVGQKVVFLGFINARVPGKNCHGWEQFPQAEQVYTVRSVSAFPVTGGVMLRLEEVVNAPSPYIGGIYEIGFAAERFRPVVERKTDISIFKAMLNPSDERVSA